MRAVAAAARISKLESEISEVREQLRASARREKALAEDVKRAASARTSEALLQEQITSLQTRCTRAENSAAEAGVLRARLTSVRGALALWEGNVYNPLHASSSSSSKNLAGAATLTSSYSSSASAAATGTAAPSLGSSFASFTGFSSSSSPPSSSAEGDAIAAEVEAAHDHSAAVCAALRELQTSHSMLLSAVTEAQAKLATCVKGREDLASKYAVVSSQLSEAQSARAVAEEERVLVSARLDSATTRCERLAALVASYEAEDRTASLTRVAAEAQTAAVALASAAAGPGGSAAAKNKALSAASEAAQASKSAAAAAAAEATAAKNRAAAAEEALARARTTLDNMFATVSSSLMPQSVLQACESRAQLAEAEAAALRAELTAVYASVPRIAGSVLAAAGGKGNRSTVMPDSLESEPSGMSVWPSTPSDGRSGAAAAESSSSAAAASVDQHRPYRVLHMVANPTAAALADAEAKQRALVDSLKAEAARLRERLAAAGTQIAQLTVAVVAAKKADEEHAAAAAAAAVAASAKANKSSSSSAASTPANAGSRGPSAAGASSSSSSTPGTGAATLNPNNMSIVSGGGDNNNNNTIAAGSDDGKVDKADFDKYRERLKGLFKEQIETFRTVVYRLTGWHVSYANKQGWKGFEGGVAVFRE